MSLPSRHFADAAFGMLLSTGLAAQSAPPTGLVSTVGTVNQQQSGGPLGEQRIGAICAPAFFRPLAPVGAGGVALGGSIAWWSEAIHPTLQPATLQVAGTCITLFMVSPFLFTSIPLPFAAAGHQWLYESPLLSVVTVAPWTQVLTSGGGAVVPAGGYDRWFMTVDVPNLPALIGTVWSAQSARVDGSNMGIYLSDEYLVQVWNSVPTRTQPSSLGCSSGCTKSPCASAASGVSREPPMRRGN